MILVTGGTGFIGRALSRHLVESGYPVRILLRPTNRTPRLPAGIPVDVTLCSINDVRGLSAAMVGIDTVFHLVGGEWRGARANLMDIDIQGTRAVVEACREAGVKRFFFVSHIGADRASAYPVLKAKAIAEEIIRRSGINFTIFRTAIVYGPGDGLTTGIARILQVSPGIFLVPGDGRVILQPLWIEDLVTCLTWALEDPQTNNITVDIGGPEFLPFYQVVEMVMKATRLNKRLLHINPPYLRGLTVFLESILPGLPVSVFWLDYLAANRTTSLDTIPRIFGLMPSRMSHRLAYLETEDWRRSLIRQLGHPD